MSVAHPARVSLKLRDLNPLFHSRDPSPFLDRDREDDAEEFISSARGLRPNGILRGPALWWTWIAANAAGELVGLAIPAHVGLLMGNSESSAIGGRVAEIAGAGAMVAAGAAEGAIVGLLQASVLRRAIPALNAWQWTAWTALGSAIAWTLGIIPAAISRAGDDIPVPDFEPTGLVTQMILAAVLGILLGPVLALPQWRVLRRHVHRAAWWIPANALAWACAMPIVFLAAGTVTPNASVERIVVIAAIAFTAAGALVGAIHGGVLVWLTSREEAPAHKSIFHRS